MSFLKFASVIDAQLQKMESGENLFAVDVEADELWNTYINSYPDGTDPIYKVNTTHNCNICRGFIKTMGGVVSIQDDYSLETIWDGVLDHFDSDDVGGYRTVAKAMRSLILSRPILNRFFHLQRKVGSEKTYTGETTFNHLHHILPVRFVTHKKEERLGEESVKQSTFYRAMKELDPSAIETVLDLINNNLLYRGSEFRSLLRTFKTVQDKFMIQDEEKRYNFSWRMVEPYKNVTGIRNSSIGTLLVNLSNGMDVEEAVSAFERIMAPTNYRRPKALVTSGMIEKAKQKIIELGLESALQRRFATISDISINDILYVNRKIANQLKPEDDLFGGITPSDKGKVNKVAEHAQEIGIEEFIRDVLPTINSFKVLFERKNVLNLVSLIAPTDPNGGKLLKWGNEFSWSYNGNLTDSIKQRVAKAGGKVDADVCIRLSWFNTDDLDLHCIEPNGNEIFFNSKRNHNGNGRLDVDMNAGGLTLTEKPVENIYFSDLRKMQEGTYKVNVHQYKKRNDANVNPGFVVEFESGNIKRTFHRNQAVLMHLNVTVLEFHYSIANGIQITKSIAASNESIKEWGIETGAFHDVKIMMLSPNHWHSAYDNEEVNKGNKHYFFMLDGCRNDGTPRALYNEFLRGDLHEHRKVIEQAGEKLKVIEQDDQLSGIGFSSTVSDELIVKVAGNFPRLLKIVF